MEKSDRKNIEDILALTPMQEGMLFHYLKDPRSNAYFEQLNLRIEGTIDIKRFEQAWNFVIETNEMLRAVFRWEKVENPTQIILKEHKLQLKYYNFSARDTGEVEARKQLKMLEELKVRDRMEKFDLRKVPFRVTLCKVEEEKYEMIISNHHILYDGWSNGIILKEFFQAYNNLWREDEFLQPPVKTKFKEFVKWIQNRDIRKQEKFWKNYLNGFDAQIELSIKRKRKEDRISTGIYRTRFKKDTVIKLENFVKKHKITLATSLYTAWGLLLQRYNNSNDVIFGTTISGRTAGIEGIEEMVGLFINTLPLRVQGSGGEKTRDLLYRIDKALQMREPYEYTPLVNIKEYSEIDSKEELFDSIVVVENYPLDLSLRHEEDMLSLSGNSYSMVENTHYDLTIGITVTGIPGDDMEVNFGYQEGLFDKGSIERLYHHLVCILKDIIENPGKKISDLEILSGKEKSQLLADFNKTEAQYPKDKTLHQLFADQAVKTPDRVAIVGAGFRADRTGDGYQLYQLTYGELNKRSNQLARWLRGRGVTEDTIVGMMLDRSPEMIIGILGILKAGGAYLPIDPDYPERRKQYILKDSNAKVLLTIQTHPDRFAATPLKRGLHPAPSGHPRRGSNKASQEGNFFILDINRNTLKDSSAPVTRSPPPATPNSLAYVIYTSGTSGKPKGVMVEHEAIVNTLSALHRMYPFTQSDVYLLKTSYLFDVSVTELFGWYWGAGRLALLEPGGEKEPQKILDTVEQMHVTHINFVPSMLNALVDQLTPRNIGKLSGLKYIFLAGEALLQELVNKFRRLNSRIPMENIYGPTEAAVYASWYPLAEWSGSGDIPIGKPLQNVKLYILDGKDRLQPKGVPGELAIAGAGLARGYLNHPELTAKKFRRAVIGHSSLVISSSKFSPNDQCPMTNDRLYRTGDLARWMPKGNIEFLGRLDHQVKIRGFRIELGEIENQLLNHNDIKEAVVIARGDNRGEKYLCAYIAPKSINISKLREYLAKKLPDYMIPSFFMPIEKLPLTASGKINRKVLPEPVIEMGGDYDYAPPTNEIEAKLVEIWSEVLGIEKGIISINADFFEWGGHSLKATRLVSRIHKELNVIVPVAELFKFPTIRRLADYMRQGQKSTYPCIQLAEQKEYYPLSSAQKRLYILQQTEKDNITYNMSRLLVLEGELDKKRLENTFHRLMRRHESFRTSFIEFIEGEQEPVQQIHEEVEFEIEYYDLATEDTESTEGTRGLAPLSSEPATPLPNPQPVTSTIKNFIRPFELSKAPLLRVGLVKLQEAKHLLIVDMHHIISDGISTGVLIKDFMTIYDGKELSPVKMHYTYKDFSEWQNSGQWWEVIKSQEKYWLKEFEGEIPVLNLPTDYPRPVIQSFEGKRTNFEIGKEQTEKLKKIALKEEATLFMILLAITNILLSKLSGQEDMVMGSPVMGRRHLELERVIGIFVNMLALRNYPSGKKIFREFLGEVKERTLEALQNQGYQFEDLVERVIVNRDAARNPLFDVAFALQDLDIPGLDIPGLKLTPYEYETGIAKFDLTFIGENLENKLHFTVEYCTRLFKGETIERFTHYFKRVVTAVLENPEQTIAQIDILPGEERKQMLVDFNHTAGPYPADQTLVELFENQVEQTPDQIAIVGIRQLAIGKGEKIHISYRELNRKSHQLAGLLIERGVLADIIVGLIVERSIEMIISILGILKAGAAYLPINPKNPEERIKYLLADSDARVLITAGTLAKEVKKLRSWEDKKNFEIISLDSPEFFNFSPSHLLTFLPSHPSSLAYIIYTSGSTGKPKGIPITHANFSPLVHWGYTLGISPKDRVIQNLSYYFDWSVWEIFIALTTGVALYMITDEILLNPEAEVDFILENAITVLHITPTQYQYLINVGKKLETLKYLFIGAEKLTVDLVKRSIESVSDFCRVFNMYGPTEATIISAVLEIHSQGVEQYSVLSGVPIGKPVGNTGLLVLDRHLNLCPINVMGELYIAGDGVGQGYLNNPELTSERFINYKLQNTNYKQIPNYNVQNYKPNGINASMQYHSHSPHSPIYKTGDLARWLSDGNIEFLGRVDFQVKIRGYRIELGEIENRLLSHQAVREAIVINRESESGEKDLCAYIVPGDKRGFDDPGVMSSQLREYLSQGLPDYMIPAYFIRLDNIPLNPNNKVDRNALPEPEITGTAESYAAPTNALEKKLVEIWSEVLCRDSEISIDDNFFELGGHSLKANIVVAKINKTLNVDLSLVEIFVRPTIRELAQLIRQGKRKIYPLREFAEEKEYYPLSSPQGRLYILQQFKEDDMTYHMPGVMILEGESKVDRLEATFCRMIERHESLRTSFVMVGGEPVQKIHEEVEFEMEYYVTPETHEKHEKNKGIIKDFIRPFDLSKAPLLRVGLINLEKTKHILMIDMHHIISDGTSVGIFIKEFMALYQGEELPTILVQYKDFSEWQSSERGKQVIKQQEHYWLQQFQREIPVLELPYNFSRPLERSFEGSSVSVKIGIEETEALKQLANEENVTMFMLLMAVYKVLLSKLSWSEDIVVGTPVVGRVNAEFQHIIGMFVNTLAIRSQPCGEKTFNEFLKEIKEITLGAFEKQAYPFENLVERVAADRDASHHPLFDTMFTLQNIDIPEKEIPGLKLKPYEYHHPVSRFDMTWNGEEGEKKDTLCFTIEYNTGLFKGERINRFAHYFKEIIKMVLVNRDIRLKDIELSFGLSDSRKKMVEEASGEFGF
ncbi:MAG: amino acid adenylation domain-containing protein [Candidatus Aminicenantes bacterium]|nr:MAG: amino acid adenylation domain-containing protein [Candidatus Aminicenantes bacterium]